MSKKRVEYSDTFKAEAIAKVKEGVKYSNRSIRGSYYAQ